MKKVVLLGDSIRLIGYGKPVEERLSGEFEVWQPSDNCRFAKYMLRGLWDWRDVIKDADIIHWNNGIWDASELFGDGPFTPIDDYVKEMVRLATLLKQRAQTVIFATTTPARDDNIYNPNSRTEEYNAAVVPKLRELGIVINDLYTPLSKDTNKYICDDKIHLSSEGIAIAAEMVERVIREEAAKLDEREKKVAPSEKIADGAPV